MSEHNEIAYQEMFPLAPEDTPWRKLTSDHISTIEVEGRTIVKVGGEAIALLAETAMRDINHLYRPKHLEQLALILDDPEPSENDRYVSAR